SAYSIGWICALPLELAASVGMFDETHQDLDLARGDRNMYTLGEMAGHNIVMACLPAGSTGVTPAATVAANMLRSFPKIRFGLMVGIGGGAPARRARPHEDIRLGDVVVSIPQGELGGVVKYDCGKTVAGGAFEHTGLLNMPPAPLANAVAKLRGMHEAKRSAVSRYVTTMINKVMAGEDANPEFEELYRCPDPKYDQLFAADEDEDDIPLPCPHCDPARLVQRKPRKHPGPVIHYGTIASADQVMRHALTRDAIRKKHGILCFDMEAAGLMNDFPCLVVRGICDYADTHKHKIWQRYAAATAAAYTKELLQVVLREEVQTTEEVVKILERGDARDIKQNVDRLAKGMRAIIDKARQDRDRILNWLDSDTHTKRLLDSYEKWQPSTVRKLFESEAYRDWTLGEAQTLWCPGIAGGGKTVFSSVVVRSLKAGQEAQPDASRAAVICLFCEYERQKEQTLRTLAAAMLRQLADQCELLPDELVDLFEKHGTGASSHLRFEDISLALTRVLKEFPRVYLIVDALDECSDQTRRELLAQLAEQQRKTGLRILATARPTVEFEKEFGTKYQVLEIRADVLDVKSVLDALIDKSNSFVREDEELRRRVTDTIAFAVDGMFLLAQPFHDSVIGERSRGHVEDALQTLMDSPDKLATVYENALGRIGGQKPGDRNLAHRMLSWVVESKRPLTRDEFLHALAIQTGRPQFQRHYMIENLDGAVALCAGLVVINERSDTVQLMHHTARTYLEDPERRPGWMAGSREMIASACVTYISYSVFEDGPCRGDEEMGRRLDDYPFLPYAAQHWGHH
ncbi:nucleoside phosphorylase, partial [Emericellopsis atlantica]